MTATAPDVDVVGLDMVGWMIAQNGLASARASGTPARMVPRVTNGMATVLVEGVIAVGAIVSPKVTLHPSPQVELEANLRKGDGLDHCVLTLGRRT